jgi:hypothetical protein
MGQHSANPADRIAVAYLLSQFATALASLTDIMDAVGIPWRPGEAYDEWDSIAETLFKAIVGRALGGTESGARPLPPYAVVEPSYRELSRVRLRAPNLPSDAMLFELSASDGSFDVVRWMRVTDVGEVLEGPSGDAALAQCDVVVEVVGEYGAVIGQVREVVS